MCEGKIIFSPQVSPLMEFEAFEGKPILNPFYGLLNGLLK